MTEQEQRKKQRLSSDGSPHSEQASAQRGGGAAERAPRLLAAIDNKGANVARFPAPPRLVLVWDLDETLLVFNSLLMGTFAAALQRPQAAAQLKALGRRWEAAILALSDAHFFFGQLEEYDQCCLEEALRHDDGASLAGRDFAADGFPPSVAQPSRKQQQQGQQQGPLAGGCGTEQQGQKQLRLGQQRAQQAAPPHLQEQQLEDMVQQQLADADTEVAVRGQGATADGPASLGTHSAERATTPAQTGSLASPFGAPACASLDEASLASVAHRYRRIQKLFNFGLHALGSAAQRGEWEALYRETDAATSGWLRHASRLLAECSSLGAEVVHVAVTSGQLVPSLAKLLLFRLAGHIGADNVWSSRYCGKAACFRLVQQRFGAHCTYVAIGDGMEEDEAAAGIGWPYVRVLLAPAENYPAERVLSWRSDAATGGPGLPFTQLTAWDVARAAGLSSGGLAAMASEAAHGGSAAAKALAA